MAEIAKSTVISAPTETIPTLKAGLKPEELCKLTTTSLTAHENLKERFKNVISSATSRKIAGRTLADHTDSLAAQLAVCDKFGAIEAVCDFPEAELTEEILKLLRKRLASAEYKDLSNHFDEVYGILAAMTDADVTVEFNRLISCPDASLPHYLALIETAISIGALPTDQKIIDYAFIEVAAKTYTVDLYNMHLRLLLRQDSPESMEQIKKMLGCSDFRVFKTAQSNEYMIKALRREREFTKADPLKVRKDIEQIFCWACEDGLVDQALFVAYIHALGALAPDRDPYSYWKHDSFQKIIYCKPMDKTKHRSAIFYQLVNYLLMQLARHTMFVVDAYEKAKAVYAEASNKKLVTVQHAVDLMTWAAKRGDSRTCHQVYGDAMSRGMINDLMVRSLVKCAQVMRVVGGLWEHFHIMIRTHPRPLPEVCKQWMLVAGQATAAIEKGRATKYFIDPLIPEQIYQLMVENSGLASTASYGTYIMLASDLTKSAEAYEHATKQGHNVERAYATANIRWNDFTDEDSLIEKIDFDKMAPSDYAPLIHEARKWKGCSFASKVYHHAAMRIAGASAEDQCNVHCAMMDAYMQYRELEQGATLFGECFPNIDDVSGMRIIYYTKPATVTHAAIDFHGFSRATAYFACLHLFRKDPTRTRRFMVGKASHSWGGVSPVRDSVQKFAGKYNISCWSDEMNEAVLICTPRKNDYTVPPRGWSRGAKTHRGAKAGAGF